MAIHEPPDDRSQPGGYAEEPFFFESAVHRLFGVLHSPHRAGQPLPIPPRGVVLCSPLAEEKGIAHRPLVLFARFLASHGFHVFRFDYRGTGDSQGDFEETTLSACLTDTARAVQVLRERAGVERPMLLGLRLGGTVAALAAGADPSLGPVVLWEPVTDPRSYYDQFFRMAVVAEQLRTGGAGRTREDLARDLADGRAVDVLGFILGAQAYREFSGVELIPERLGAGPTLVLGLGRSPKPRPELEALAEAHRRRGGAAEVIQVPERPFWGDPNNAVREIASWWGHEGLFGRTLAWFEAAV
ncbi:MAG: alpha/beta hydrolase [Deltaproteobacteria bacterium]|nr:alpha/beta hydrolase [Deltaproteobacteria bacterium]